MKGDIEDIHSKEGYVSKRSVKLIEPIIETEETEKQETIAE